MFRYLIPTILIGVSIAGFFIFARPIFSDITILKREVASYNQALDNAKALEIERDKLTNKYNSIDPELLSKLEKLLPDNVDNIRLILEIQKIASPYGMILKEVKYSPVDMRYGLAGKEILPTSESDAPILEAEAKPEDNKSFGTWDLEFSVQSSYQNFKSFLKDLENNLRIVDVSSIQFSSIVQSTPGKIQANDFYKYNFKIKTYWLKN